MKKALSLFLVICMLFSCLGIFSVGAALSIFGRLLTLPQSEDFRVRRLNNMLAVSAVLVLISAYLMFKGENIAILTLFISAFIDIYTSFRYPKEK
jgi:hypothetical protein